MKQQRPFAVITAAVICAVSSVVAFSTLVGPAPRPVAYVLAMAGAVGLGGAYGVWRLKRWGVVLAVIFLALNALLSVPGIPFAPSLELQLSATTIFLVDLAAIFLLLIPSSRKVYA